MCVKSFKIELKWNDEVDDTWIDRNRVGLLFYAATYSNVYLVKDILSSIQHSQRQELIDARITKKGFPQFGIPGLCSPLLAAMVTGSQSVVQILLESGANPYVKDAHGNDPLMGACVYGRFENVKFWLDKMFCHWDLERRSNLGGCALGCALYMGPNRLGLVKYLISKGAVRLSVLISLYLSISMNLSLYFFIISIYALISTSFTHNTNI